MNLKDEYIHGGKDGVGLIRNIKSENGVISVERALVNTGSDSATIPWVIDGNKINIVNTFASKIGEITIRGGLTDNGSINLTMSENELLADAVGLKSFAFKDSIIVSDVPSLPASKITSGTFSADRIPSINLTSKVSGILPVANGGTGTDTLTGLLFGNGTSAITASTPGANSTTPKFLTVTTDANSIITPSWNTFNTSENTVGNVAFNLENNVLSGRIHGWKNYTTSTPNSTSSDDTIPTSKAVYNAMLNAVSTVDAIVYKGVITGDTLPAANKGNLYKINKAGSLSGVTVEIGDMVICNTDDTPANTPANWDFILANLDPTLYVTLLGKQTITGEKTFNSGCLQLKGLEHDNITHKNDYLMLWKPDNSDGYSLDGIIYALTNSLSFNWYNEEWRLGQIRGGGTDTLGFVIALMDDTDSHPIDKFRISREGNGYLNGNLILTSGNYNTYSPTLTGIGASGTWPISISGYASSAGNADTVDGYHQGKNIHYSWTNTYTQPTSGEVWYLKISTVDWNSDSEWIYVRCKGDNAYDGYVIYTGSRSSAWWAYGVQYTNQLIDGCTKSISTSSDIYIRLTAYCKSVTLYTTFTPKEITNESASYYITLVPGLNASTFYGNATSTTKLQTARTIWGQSFDGTKNIDGYIKMNIDSSPDDIADYIGLRVHRSVATSDAYGVSLMLSAYQNKGIEINGGGYGGRISYYNGTSFNRLVSFSPNGNVGISTTIPRYKLDIYTTSDNGIRIYNTTETKGVSLKVGDNTPYISFAGEAFDIIYNSSNCGDWHPTNRYLTILKSGNVGIGAASPYYNLHVNGTIGSNAVVINTSIVDHANPTELCLLINSSAVPSGVSLSLKNSPGIGFHISGSNYASLVYNGTFNFINYTADGYVSVAASSFIKEGSNDNYILLGGGGHKAISDFMLKTETLTNNLTTITKTLTVSKEWMDTGIKYTDLTTGTYAVQVSSYTTDNLIWDGYWSGIMTWYGSITNSSEADEILLHRGAHAYNGNTIYLRTINSMYNDGRHMRLQIAANKNFASATYVFKFKKLI